MAEVALAPDAVIITVLDTGDRILREIDMVVFFSHAHVLQLLPRRTATLTNRHPEMGLPHPALWKKPGQETHLCCESLGLVKPILKKCLAQL